ncbi:LamG domain-containing protein [Candidatus Poribacteria bacterium]|nr:LamG domain-containing protein [Candidatus Poribacteria bacterium]
MLDGKDDYAALDFKTYGVLFKEGTNELTLEAWVYPTSPPDSDAIGIILSQQVVIYTASYVNVNYIDLRNQMHWEKDDLLLVMYAYIAPLGVVGNAFTGSAPMTILPYQWHYIAFQVGNGKLISICDEASTTSRWVDPVEHDLFKKDPNVEKRTRGDFVLGGYGEKTRIAWGPLSLWGSFAGYIDEVRVSKIMRHDIEKRHLPVSRFEPDADTIALWHFDEPIGTTVFMDSSVNKFHLVGINGATTGYALNINAGEKLAKTWGHIKSN